MDLLDHRETRRTLDREGFRNFGISGTVGVIHFLISSCSPCDQTCSFFFDFEFVPPSYTMFATRFVSVARFGPSPFRPTYSRSPLREFSSQVPSHVRRNNALVAVAIVGFVTGVYYYSIYKMSKTVSD